MGPAPVLSRLWSLSVAALLLASLVLGMRASRGAVDPALHGMTALTAAAIAVASHFRRGGAWDFVAVALLGGVAGLGLGVEGGTAVGLHLALGPPAVVLSTALHLGRWRG